jgi:hypothetical protein
VRREDLAAAEGDVDPVEARGVDHKELRPDGARKWAGASVVPELYNQTELTQLSALPEVQVPDLGDG